MKRGHHIPKKEAANDGTARARKRVEGSLANATLSRWNPRRH